MKTHHRSLVLVVLLITVLLLQSAGTPGLLAQTKSPAVLADELNAAWQRARAAGSYRFLSTTDQTLNPRPIAGMIGKSGTRVTLEYDGAVVLPDNAYMEVSLAQNRGQASVALLRAGSQAFMLRDGKLSPVNDPVSLAAPTTDFLGYLAGAENVTLLDPPPGQPQLVRYGFDVNGARFGEYVRAQAESALKSQPGAPDGVTLGQASALGKMSGHGELWVNAHGLPVRQVLDVDLPEVTDEYSAVLHMVVDLTGYGKVQSLPKAVQGADGSWQLVGTLGQLEGTRGNSGELTGLPTGNAALPSGVSSNSLTTGEFPRVPASSHEFPLAISPLSFFLFVLAVLAIIAVRFCLHDRRRAYLAIIGVLLPIMVFTPLLQSGQVIRFVERQAQAADARSAAAPDLLRALGIEAETPTPAPQPTRAAAAASATAVNALVPAAVATPVATKKAPRAAGSVQTQATEEETALQRCGQGTPGVDTDGDGLTDMVELCLGTSPYETDTDQDAISDKVELEGFDYNGKHWDSDPLKADTNGDGISDTMEWSSTLTTNGQAVSADVDNDGIPNLWDDDDDGDGVLDGMDLSPFALTGYTTELELSTTGAGYAGSQTIEFEVQPENLTHLRYSTTALDWPDDDKGNVQDLNGSIDDLRLTPFLLIETNVQPTAELADEYGFRTWVDDDGKTIILVPLQPVDDGGAIYTLYGKVAYAPGQTADIQWQAKMVWMAQMQADEFVNDSLTTEQRVLHQYQDSFRLTGLQVVKSDNYEATVLGTPAETDDRYIFQMFMGLSDTFMEYKTLEGQDEGAGETALEEIHERFKTGSSPTVTQTFGIPNATIAMATPTSYVDVDHGMAGVTSDLVPDYLSYYSSFYGLQRCHDANGNPISCATLLLVAESNQGVQDLRSFTRTDTRTADLNQLHVNLADVAMLTMRTMNLRMYQWDAGSAGWESVTPARMLELIDARYAGTYGTAFAAFYPNLRAEDARFIAYTSYMWAYTGRINGVAVDGRSLVPLVPDEDLLAINRYFDDMNEVTNGINYMGLMTGLAKAVNSAFAWGQGIYDATELKADWAKWTTKAAKWREGLMAGFSMAACVGTLVMGAVNMACGANKNLPGCRNETALKAANAAIDAFAVSVQTAAVTIMIIKACMKVLDDVSKASKIAGAIGLGIGIAVTWALFGVTVGFSHGDPITWRLALGMAILQTVWLVVLFALNFIPLVGQIISAILAVIDAIISLFTGLFTDSEWSIARIVLNLFYDAKTLTCLADAQFGEFESELRNSAMGMVAGNTFEVSAGATGVITKTGSGNNDDLEDSWVKGNLTASTVTGFDNLQSQDMNTDPDCDIVDGELHCSNTAALGYSLEAAVNGAASFVAKFVYNTRWAEYGLYGAFRYATHSDTKELPEEEDDQEPSDLYLDVLPATMEELWSWSALTNADRDGDGLTDSEEAALGTSATLWDTDGDGLSDYYEWQNFAEWGADPLKADTDNDGLNDGLERRLGTRIDTADTDGDGLTDGQEVRHLSGGSITGGWQMTAGSMSADMGNANVSAQSITVWVTSDPLAVDDDGDGLNASEEKANGLSPQAANDPVPALFQTISPVRGISGGRAGTYLLPGDKVTVTVNLANMATTAVTRTLTLSLPSWLTNIQGGTMQGDRTPARLLSGSQLTWAFTGANALQLYETVSTTVTAVVHPSTTSATGNITLALPYRTLSLSQSTSAVVDGDNPSVAVVAPANGAYLRGTSYVVGGQATDPTTWVTGVQLSIVPQGNAASFSALTGSTSPWAKTWSLPADGRYTLQARATDALGHTATSSAATVTVDNTAPNATATASVVDSQVSLSGTATDNLSGVSLVQISIDGQPWRSVTVTGAGTNSATWAYDWRTGTGAQGKHDIRVRAADRAGNLSAIVSQQVTIDRVAPSSAVTGGADADVPPAVKASTSFTLTGVADEGGHLPLPAVPADLKTGMAVFTDTTVWLGLSSVRDNDGGVKATWVGDFNADRLADLAVGLPGPAGDAGQVVLVYGKAGGWTTPPDLDMLADSRTRFAGASGTRLGSLLAAAGDVNGDNYADLLIGEGASSRAFLVFGNPGPLGEVTLEAGQVGYRTLLQAPATITGLAAAGDVTGDGLGDLLVVAGGTAYLVAGRANPWPATVQVSTGALASFSGVTGALGVGDADGDAIANWVTMASTITLYKWNSTTSAAATVATRTTADASPRVVALDDVDADGKADWLYSDGTSRILVYGQGASTHTFTGYDGLMAAPGDVDGDGRGDILLGTSSGVVSLIRQQAGESPEVFATISGVAGAANAPYAAGADINSDGSSDVLLIPSQAAAEAKGFDAPSLSTGFVSPDALPQAAAAVGGASGRDRQAGALSTGADTLYVDDDGLCGGNSPCYTTIQAAVDASDGGGDTIIVYPGVYKYFRVPAGKDNLTVRGVSADAVFVESDTANSHPDAIHIAADAVHLANLTVRNAAVGIYLEDGAGATTSGNATLIDHVVVHSVQRAIWMSQGAALNVTDSTLVGNGTLAPLGVDPAESASAYAWNTDRAMPLPAVSTMQPISKEGTLISSGSALYAIPGGKSRTIYTSTPGTGGALGNWTAAFDLLHYQPYDTGGAKAYAYTYSHLVTSGSWLYNVHGRINWPELGGKSNADIYAVAVAANGDVYVGGDFTSIGGITARHIARWDGTQWNTVGTGLAEGLDSGVRALAFGDNGKLYVGGFFALAGQVEANHVAAWDGSQWLPLGVSGASANGVSGTVQSLAWDGRDLFVAGNFTTAYTNATTSLAAKGIAAWRPGAGTWADLGGGATDYTVSALALANGGPYAGGSLVAAGNFTTISGVSANRIARYNGSTWSALGSGLGGSIQSITVDPTTGDVYAASDNGGSISQVYRWAGSTWTAVSGATSSYGYPALAADSDGNIYALEFNATIYIQPKGSTQLEELGLNSSLGYSVHNRAAVVDAQGHLYTGWGVSGGGGISRWVLEGIFRRSLSGGSWSRVAYPAGLSTVYVGKTAAGDDAGNLYIINDWDAYYYNNSTSTWQTLADIPGYPSNEDTAVVANGHVYTLVTSNGKLYRYDPSPTNAWTEVATAPSTPGSGVSMVYDGYDYLYMLRGGGTKGFMRYRLSTNTWTTLPDISAAFTASYGLGLARVGSYLYAYGTPDSGATTNVFRFGTVGQPDLRLTLDRTAIVLPSSASSFAWTNMASAAGTYRFETDIDTGNAWVGPSSATWSPSLPSGASTTTLTQAAFVAPEDGLYRVGESSTLAAGYHQYIGEAHVYASEAACTACGAGGDVVWGQTAFGTVREAIESGAARVLVHPGVYPQPFYLVSGVEVMGSGAGITIIQAPGSGSGTLVTAEGVAHAGLSRVTLAGTPGWQGFLAEGGAQGITLERNIIRDLKTGVRLSGGSEVELVHNTIVRNGDGYVAEGTTPVNVRNTIFAYNSGTGLKRGTSPTSLANNYNDFYANGTNMNPVDVGGGKIFFDPRFNDLAANDLTLTAGSRLIDAGAPNDPTPPGTGTRADIGYAEYNAAGFYADPGYSETGLNDGLTWGVDAFATIQGALDAAGETLRGLEGAVPAGGYSVGVAAGTYNERVTVPSYVRLVGSGAAVTTIDAGNAGSAVTFDGVVQAEVSGFTLQNASSSGAAVDAKNASNQITVARNVIRNNASRAVRFDGRSSGTVTFNTIVGNTGSGVLANGTASWAVVRNNIISGNDTSGLRALSGGLIRQDYNLFYDNTPGDLDGVAAGTHTVSGDPAFAATGHYYLTAASPALDAADPLEPVPAAGGVRADLGYKELIASPLALLFGPQIASTVTGNSGVAKVEVGIVAVSDATQPVTATLPASWVTVTPGVSGQPLFYWSSANTLGTAGYYRVYSRATDVTGNVEGNESDWYEGALVVDNTAPTVSWSTPALPGSTSAAAVLAVGQASGTVTTGTGTRFDVKQAYFTVTGPGGTVTYPAAWDSGSGTTRTFRAWVPLPATGSYTITAVAKDEAGNTGQTSASAVTATGSGHVATITSLNGGIAVNTTDIALAGFARFTTAGAGQVAVTVNGTTVQATVDNPTAALSAWSAGVTLPATDGAYTITATPSRGGSSGTAASLQVTLDRVAPTLAVDLPLAGAYVTRTVAFQGTASDASSGLDRVEVSIDGGYTWQQATLASGTWSLFWSLTDEQDFVSYPVQVRAVDHAGNITTVTRPATVDNQPPTGLAPVTFGQPEGQHVAVGTNLSIAWNAPADASGTAEVLLAVDQNATTEPSVVMSGSSSSVTLNAVGDWYVHLAARDALGNMRFYHYGPWHVRDMTNGTFSARRQSIVVDGFIDLRHNEWLASDLLGTDVRTLGTQQLYTSWDGQAIYLGWSGAWWTLDGTLWAYLDVATGGSNQWVGGGHTVPFQADLAMQIDGPAIGKLWVWNGAAWAESSDPTAWSFVNGSAGDTEARVRWSVGAGQTVQLVAFALTGAAGGGSASVGNKARSATAGTESVWAMFPNTNGLEQDPTQQFTWTQPSNVTNTNSGQPQARTVNIAVSSPQASGTAWCAGSTLQYTITLRNPEPTSISGLTMALNATTGLGYQTVTGATRTAGAVGGQAWTLSVPTIAAGATQQVVVTAQLAGSLSGLTSVSSTFALSAGTTPLTDPSSATLSHRVDGQAPTVTISTLAGSAIAAGSYTFTGVAADAGSGVTRVEVRPAGGTWQTANGTLDWSAALTVPAGATYTLEARAVDFCGHTSSVASYAFTVDTTAPQVSLTVPAVVNGLAPVMDGTTSDPAPVGALVSQVQVQVDSESGAWLPGTGPYAPASGVQGWTFGWDAPQEDGVTHQLRARAIDAVGNTTTSAWQSTLVDNVAPVVTVTTHLDEIAVSDYMTTGSPNIEDLVGSGVAAAGSQGAASARAEAMAGAPVLSGTITDGSGVQQVRVRVYTPLGQAYTEAASLVGGSWAYSPHFVIALVGNYVLHVEAVDVHGNVRVLGPYDVYVRDQAIGGLQAYNDGPSSQFSPTTLFATITGGTNVTYSWNFGDGSATATGRIVTHTYTTIGTFAATVTAHNSLGDITVTTSVVVNKPTGYLEVRSVWPAICAGWNEAFDITYRNNTGIPLTNVRLVVTVPAQTMVEMTSGSAGLVEGPGAGQVMWNVGTIGIGQSVTRRVVLHLYSNIPNRTLVQVPVTAYSAEGNPIARSAVVEVRTDGLCLTTPTPGPTSTPSPTPVGTVTPTPTVEGTPTPTPTPSSTPQPGDLVLSGTVYSVCGTGTPAPLAGARVTVKLCNGGTYEATTDANGYYQLIIPAAALEGCSEVTIEVAATGHAPYSQVYLVSDLRANPQLDLTLTVNWGIWLPRILQ